MNAWSQQSAQMIIIWEQKSSFAKHIFLEITDKILIGCLSLNETVCQMCENSFWLSEISSLLDAKKSFKWWDSFNLGWQLGLSVRHRDQEDYRSIERCKSQLLWRHSLAWKEQSNIENNWASKTAASSKKQWRREQEKSDIWFRHFKLWNSILDLGSDCKSSA